MHIEVCVVFCIVLLAKDNGVYADISCTAAEMPEGLKSEVVCNFGKDIRSPRQTFMVWKYPLNTTSFDSKLRSEVLNCAWNSDLAAQPPQVCIVGEGYSYNYNHNVINTVTVDIDDVTKDHEGIYECQLVSDHSIPSTRCALTVAKTSNLVCYWKDNAVACKADDGTIFLKKDIDTLQLEIPDDSFGEGHSDIVYTRLGDKEKAADTITIEKYFALAPKKKRRSSVTELDALNEEENTIFNVEKESEDNKPEEDHTPADDMAKPITANLNTVDETNGATDVTNQPVSDLEYEEVRQQNTVSQPCLSRHRPALSDENSDTWTMSQVCQWVRQLQGGRFKEHVDCFSKNNVNGKALLSYYFAVSLKIYLGMGGGVDGNDRRRMMEHIGQLRQAVQQRKAREKSNNKSWKK